MSDTPDDATELEVVTLTDEDGQDRDFAFLVILELDEANYAVLAPIDQLETEAPDLDLFAFLYTEDDDGISLDAVEDDELLDRIFELAEVALFDDGEDEDEDAPAEA